MIRKTRKLLNERNIGKALIFLSILSFFCGDLSINIGFTLRPFHIVAALSLVYLFFTKKEHKTNAGISLVDKAFVVFLVVSLFGALLSPYSVGASMKHIVGMVMLAGSFYIFKRLYCRYDAKEVMKIVSVAGIAIIAVTIIWYVIGLVTLGFNFNIKDTFCFGVRVDRKIPRLISFAYNEPNYVSIYFSILFSYYLTSKRNAMGVIGLIGTFAIIVLTMSRGGYLAFVALMLAYLIFSKEKLKERLIKTGIIVLTAVISFACITTIINKKTDSDKPTKTAFSLMISRFSQSISDNGSDRLVHWEDAVKTFKKYPVTGIGSGNIVNYNKDTYGSNVPSHNTYLDVLAEQGVIGCVAYALLIIVIIVSCWKIRAYSAMPALGFVFLFASEMFLSLAVTDMLFINILAIDVALFFSRRKKNYDIVNAAPENHSRVMSSDEKKLKLSFIVPVYNVEEYIERCLDSLVCQSPKEYEIIVIDDGSTDSSTEICKRYAEKCERIKYYRVSNGGLSSARNYGIEKAKGDYVWFIDSDDFISKDALSRVIDNLNHDIVVVGYYNYYDDYNISDGNDSQLKDTVARYIMNPALAQLKIVKRDILKDNKLKFELNRSYEDVALMYDLVNYTDDIYHCNEKLYFYRRRQNSISSTFSEKNFADHLWAAEKAFRNKGAYNAEKEYQIAVQILFSLFDINKNNRVDCERYFSEARELVIRKIPQIKSNKYLTKKNGKNLFYYFYISKLLNRKYNCLMRLNSFRKISR